MGSLALNWGVFAGGLVLFGVGSLWMSFLHRAYKRHVLRYGRVKFGKEYGTSWTKADDRGVILMRGAWTGGSLGIAGVLLFFFTSLPKIGLPLWIGCMFGISGIILLIVASATNMGLAKREAQIAMRHMLEDEDKGGQG